MAESTTMDNMNSTAVVEQRTGILSNVRRLTSDPSFQKSFPSIAAVGVLVIGLIIYMFLQQPSLTPLYASLPEAEKARVVEALKNAGYDLIDIENINEEIKALNFFNES